MKSVDYKAGDYVICVRNHTQNRVRKGEIYIMRSVSRNPCCGSVIADVGFRSPGNTSTTCYACNFTYKIDNDTHWLAGFLFRKLLNPPISEELIEEINQRLAMREQAIEQGEKALEPVLNSSDSQQIK
jgi:uncharacterized protein YlaI